MSKVLFLGVPSHGHTNPTIGLVAELVKRGEEVVYFSSEQFKDKIEATGAVYKPYIIDLDLFKMGPQGEEDEDSDPFLTILQSTDLVINDILEQTQGYQFDYIIHSVSSPFARIMAQMLQVPTVSSLAVYSGLQGFLETDENDEQMKHPLAQRMMRAYGKVSKEIEEKYSVQMPDDVMQLMFNKGDLNLVYTSDYFLPDEDRKFLYKIFGDTVKFVGPPVFDRKENLDFPFEKLAGKKVIYVSLGTVFGNFNRGLYDIFFRSFADMDAVVVMTAYGVDISQFTIPDNFIVRNYVPQSAILRYANAAVTHAGMNSMSDLIYNEVPFVSLPLGADQPEMTRRAEELGATIALDANTITPELLRSAVEKVMNEDRYRESIHKISESFKNAGGYRMAVDEIFKLKHGKGIL
ncbi:macrolide family glycosyltransferase [Taibaiella soli]|uniref:Glycosyl transferase n=1 Tax=Taibaiella soli TaxID=1649169 RepID=A0A2W2AGV8_9BACT|nr:macrolide family glycosyltransferase [Taibaiella soli]PZF71450.1 glycosyl transferase [Taibaiella soli]